VVHSPDGSINEHIVKEKSAIMLYAKNPKGDQQY
jgi:hypothetical protein